MIGKVSYYKVGWQSSVKDPLFPKSWEGGFSKFSSQIKGEGSGVTAQCVRVCDHCTVSHKHEWLTCVNHSLSNAMKRPHLERPPGCDQEPQRLHFWGIYVLYVKGRWGPRAPWALWSWWKMQNPWPVSQDSSRSLMSHHGWGPGFFLSLFQGLNLSSSLSSLVSF
jgi:hypothetical protein